ncbi:MAG: patatin-like phospholipase family protein [Inconstantimicrobium porci]|uniref:patatin-like phospholipase family protein n=1 Tax=Inconstantimicrobium porci TaxID=2652291 RepID=UPI002A91240B|nr:patatin-like phospholipase family protein [Inconstantimicrobium porci]MDY5910527.1 patatin-like phospholipase family protein [Inconstantimicrobium porci]
MQDIRNIALVLGGGGGRGAYQIGVWKALREFGIEKNIKAVSGTSIGGINAAFFAQGSYEKAESLWRNISSEQIVVIDAKKIISEFLKNFDLKSKKPTEFFKNIADTEVISRNGLVEIVEKYINIDYIANSNIKCILSCTEIPQFKAHYFDVEGKNILKIKKALMATSAFPVVFDPVNIDGHLYIDGGAVDNIPIKPLYDLGYRKFIVVHFDINGKIDYSKYKGAVFTIITPSIFQGGMITGAFNFNKITNKMRLELGYRDTVLLLKNQGS